MSSHKRSSGQAALLAPRARWVRTTAPAVRRSCILRHGGTQRVDERRVWLVALDEQSLPQDRRLVTGVPGTMDRVHCELIEGHAVVRLQDELGVELQGFGGLRTVTSS